jgi:hypothetical protein
MVRRCDALPAESHASGDGAAQTDHLDAGDRDVSASQRSRTIAKSTGTGPGSHYAKIAFIGATTENQVPGAAEYRIVAANANPKAGRLRRTRNVVGGGAEQEGMSSAGRS